MARNTVVSEYDAFLPVYGRYVNLLSRVLINKVVLFGYYYEKSVLVYFNKKKVGNLVP